MVQKRVDGSPLWRGYLIGSWVTKDEQKEIRRFCERHDMTVSDLLRIATLAALKEASRE